MVLEDTIELSKAVMGLVSMSLTVVKMRGFRKKEHAPTQGKHEEKGQTQSDTPLGSILKSLSAKVDTVREEDTKGDKELVATDDGTTYMVGC